MRMLTFLLLFTSGLVWAQTYSEQAQVYESELKASLDQVSKEYEFDQEKFTQKHGKILDEHLQRLTSLYKKLCLFPGTKGCPTEREFQQTLAQYRIQKGVVQRKNEWRNEGPSSQGLRSQEDVEGNCTQGGQGCSELPEAERTVASEVSLTPEVTVISKEESTVNEDEKNPRNYRPDTCEWVEDLPKKIANGPGCGGSSRSRICTGYVICNQKVGGGKFIRMSTCRPEFCGPTRGDAINCTKDMRYFSERPYGEKKLFMTKKVKKVLSTEQ